MKKKKSTVKHAAGKVISFSQRLNNPKLSKHAIEELKTIEDVPLVNAIVRRAGESCRNRIFSLPTPSSYSLLKNGHLGASLSDVRLIKWLQYEILAYSSQINKFVELQNNYELAFIDGNYGLAKEYLSSIKDICVSLWSLENEFILLQFSEGLHANLAYLSDLNKDDNVSILIKIFATFYSKKAENNISASKYKDELDAYLGYYNNVEYQDVYDYLNYRLLPDNLFEDKTKTVLRLESNSSIIDRYITFKEALRKSVYAVESDSQKDLFSVAVSIGNCIHDSELDHILTFITSNDCQLISASTTKDFITICDLYTSGKYSECVSEATASLKYIGNSFELYEIIAKSATFFENFDFSALNVGALQLDLLKCLFDVFKKSENYEISFRKLYKLSFTLSTQAWARQLYAVLLLEMASSENSLILADNLLQSKFINPKIVLAYIDKEKRQEFLNKLLQEYCDSSTLLLWSLFIFGDKETNSSKIPFERQTLYFARFLMAQGEFQRAIELFEDLLCRLNVGVINWYFIEKVSISLVNCYISTHDYEKSLRLFIKYYLTNHYFKKRLKLDRLQEGLRSVGRAVDSLCENLIFLHVANVDSYDLYVASDNFLVAHGVDRPSKLEIEDSCSDKKYLFYVLYEVFTETVLSKLLAFDNTDEVEEERIHILHRLIEADKFNYTLYIKEMNEISIKSTIRKYINYSNEGKIYIDIDGVKKYSDENLKERFDRYLEVNKISSENFTIIDMDSEGARFYFKHPTRRFYYIRDIRFSAFKMLFLDILGVFISSKEFGLNNYLSMRIRHGTLTGQLRKPFDDANLVSQKDSTEQYQDVLYWNDNLHLPESVLSNVQECLKSFSRKIDDTISLVKSEWIQVKTEKTNTNGLFDYIFSDEEIFDIFKETLHLCDWDCFFEKIIAFLVERTNKNLETVKSGIVNNLKRIFLESLGELAGQIQSIDIESRCFRLTFAITSCKTDVQTVLNKITNWFEFSQSKKVNQFDFELAIRASVFFIGNLYKKTINLSVEKKCNSTVLFRGEYFNCVFDLLNILFENIVKHSSLNSDNDAIEFVFNINSNKLKFLVKNAIGVEYSYHESQEKLDVIIRALQSGETQFELTSIEGGSGILKIRKILQHDLRSKDWSIVPTLENSCFKIEIETDISGILYENIDN